jgi:quercetin dioxygenase-like cupin family protein
MSTASGSPVSSRETSEIHSLLDGVSAIRVSGEQTAGTFALVEQLLPQGMATPLHVQPNEDEAYYVLEGELTLCVDGALSSATAGDVTFVPRGVPHAFQVRSEHAHFLAFTTPAGHERFFRLVGDPVASFSLDAHSPEVPDFERLAAAAAQAGFEILGPPPFEDAEAS